jgi:hypothetical protein
LFWQIDTSQLGGVFLYWRRRADIMRNPERSTSSNGNRSDDPRKLRRDNPDRHPAPRAQPEHSPNESEQAMREALMEAYNT